MTHHKHPHLVHPKYRPDIDGLRAIAILAVVIFHAFPSIMPGGFIGVDIFFVISGFLISSIIFSSLERDRFSLVEFYARRVKRIFPALILVLISCLVFGWFVLFADEYKQLGKHTAAGAGFIQNFVLWRESGYFDNSAATKPLLHLWSLAIEEQFYFFWPLLLAFVWKRQWNFLRITAVIAAVSFAANIYLILSAHPTAAFYLPFSRFWELMVGGVLAYVVLHRPQLIERHKDVQSFLGFALILVGLLLLNKERDFPGWWALLPTLGAFFIISAGPSSWLNEKLLANKPMVWVGLISYPLYLWHWPILAFLKIMFPNCSERMSTVGILFSTLLAWLTYTFIEQKVKSLGSRAVIPLNVSMILIALLGTSLFFLLGIPKRDVNKPLIHFESKLFEQSRRSDGSCLSLLNLKDVDEEVCLANSAKPKVLFVGDSHAMALYSAIYAGKFSENALLISGHSCPTYPNLLYTPTYQHSWGNNCTEIAKSAINAANTLSSIDTVVIVNYAPRDEIPTIFSDGNHSYNEKEAFIVGNQYLIESLLSSGKKVIFVVDTPKLNSDVHSCVKRPLVEPKSNCAQTTKELNDPRSNYRESLQKLQVRFPKLIVFDPTPMFCDSENCRFKNNDGDLMYNDSHHISIVTSNQLLESMFKNSGAAGEQ